MSKCTHGKTTDEECYDCQKIYERDLYEWHRDRAKYYELRQKELDDLIKRNRP